MYKVLVVDDENMIRLSFKNLINWGNYDLELVSICCNGEEALEYMLCNPVDILITDIKMPIMNGISLLKELKYRNIEPMAIIVLSAFNEYQLIRDCLKLKVDDYILKSDYDEDNVIDIILNVIKNKTYSSKENLNANLYSYEINSTLDYLSKNYHKNITLKSISNQIGYSESYLSRLFSTEIGITITDYLNKLRVEKSKILLDSTSFKIYEICEKVGFQSVEHFSRCFKKYEGVSPKQYKSKNFI